MFIPYYCCLYSVTVGVFQVSCCSYGCAEMGWLHCVRKKLLPAKHRPHPITSGAVRWGNDITDKCAYCGLYEMCGDNLIHSL